ncbi:MAG TPA: hypothetical protein DCY88_06095 [Cyanobacteria bacterium UBA11372]|nr:hypothetical protein [Cyanobacteria bacterium UBA11372]HBE53641.1 hypothetical protein [Cyanobacteria bacterium UBA11369]
MGRGTRKKNYQEKLSAQPIRMAFVLFATASAAGICFNFVQKADAICCHCAYFHPLRSQPLSEICHSWLRSLFILDPEGYRANGCIILAKFAKII